MSKTAQTDPTIVVGDPVSFDEINNILKRYVHAFRHVVYNTQWETDGEKNAFFQNLTSVSLAQEMFAKIDRKQWEKLFKDGETYTERWPIND